ncbi:ATP-binding cassette domain-containing protein [Candidatus Borrarchaeum sp.]|uniref:ATP-binding cassette domain-containing protein n=1 Tax=Candidatus Borrarchaeum sp. TaxID=2846742 RepID=UPI00257CA573|nr:ATP-binding cassette domain-containing protein [Candidatus Borrarchaeum sp.]
MAKNVIEVRNLTKVFDKTIKAVDHINFEVEQGEIFGFLGPNGAGKTTTISMLATILKPTEGNATICGHDIIKEPDTVRRCIGIVFQDPSLDDRLTGRENLDFHARLYRIQRDLRKKRITEVLELVNLTEQADRLVETYSGGMKRRLEIARGLMHYPHVLFLDEPTIGLDPQSRRAIWSHIERLNKEEDITIMLSTHYMEEADHLCARIAIIDHGQIVACNNPMALKDELGGDIILLRPVNGTLMEHLLGPFQGLEWIRKISPTDGIFNLVVDQGEKRIPQVLAIAKNAGVEIASVGLNKPTLDDVFLHFTGRRIREERGDRASMFKTMMRARNRRR